MVHSTDYKQQNKNHILNFIFYTKKHVYFIFIYTSSCSNNTALVGRLVLGSPTIPSCRLGVHDTLNYKNSI